MCLTTFEEISSSIPNVWFIPRVKYVPGDIVVLRAALCFSFAFLFSLFRRANVAASKELAGWDFLGELSLIRRGFTFQWIFKLDAPFLFQPRFPLLETPNRSITFITESTGNFGCLLSTISVPSDFFFISMLICVSPQNLLSIQTSFVLFDFKFKKGIFSYVVC